MHEEVTPIRTYALVTLALVVLTFATIGASYLPIGGWHGVVALAFATVKALLVLLYFMHLRFDSKWFSFIFFIPFVLVIPMLIVLRIG